MIKFILPPCNCHAVRKRKRATPAVAAGFGAAPHMCQLKKKTAGLRPAPCKLFEKSLTKTLIFGLWLKKYIPMLKF